MNLPIEIRNHGEKAPLFGVATALCALCTVLFVYIRAVDRMHGYPLTYLGSVIPEEVWDARGLSFVGELITFETYAFFHDEPSHLLYNLFWLFFYGRWVEKAFGVKRMLLYLLLFSPLTALAYIYITASTGVMLMGISGFSAFIMAAFLVLCPQARFVHPAGWIPAFSFPAWWVMIASVVYDMAAALHGSTDDAYSAHVIGYIGGIAVAAAFRRENTPIVY